MDFAKLRRMLDEATVSAGKTNAENAARQAMEMQSIHELALVTSEALRETNVKEVMLVALDTTPNCDSLQLITPRASTTYSRK